MVWKSDHRNTLRKPHVPSCERQGKLFGKGTSILSENLIEVTEAHDGDMIRIVLPQLDIPLPYRGALRLFRRRGCLYRFFRFCVVLVGWLVVWFFYGLLLFVRCHHVEDGHLWLWFRLGWLILCWNRGGLGHGCFVYCAVHVVERFFDGILLEVMYRPAVHDSIFDAGKVCTLFGLFFCFIAGKF